MRIPCRTILAGVFLTVGATLAVAIDVSPSSYSSWSELMASWYGIDENEGLTTLPVLSIPSGGRAESLGTAFSAVADDASFLDWNPAGSASLNQTELAFFHNNWIADTKIESAIFSIREGNLGLAVGGKWLYLPFTEYDDYAARASKGYYTEGVGTLNVAYKFFSGYYFDGLSVGTNLKGAFRSVPDYSTGSGASQSGVTAMVDIGLLTRFNLIKFYNSREHNMAAALVVRNAGFPLLEDPLPTVVTAGLSWKPIKPLLFSFDLSKPLNLTDLALSEKLYCAGGIQAQVTNFLSMRSGILIKPANIRFSLGSGFKVADIDLDVTYTLDLLTQAQILNRISIAARFDFGDRGRAAKAQKVEELYLKGLEEYAQGNTETALELWREVLKLDKGFDPASEGINAIMTAKSLEQRIDDIQKLE